MDSLDRAAHVHQALNVADNEYQRKFKMFFVSLDFAVLSFIEAHPSKSHLLFIKFPESSSLFCLLIAGLLMLAKLTERGLKNGDSLSICKILRNNCKFWLRIKTISYYFIFHSVLDWVLFIMGMVLVVFTGVSLIISTP